MTTTRTERTRFQGMLALAQEMRNRADSINERLHTLIPGLGLRDVVAKSALRLHVAHLEKTVAMMREELEK